MLFPHFTQLVYFAPIIDLAFERLPTINFTETPLNWNNIIQENIFGPFAPKSGILCSMRNTQSPEIQRLMKRYARRTTNTNFPDMKRISRITKIVKKNSIMTKTEIDLLNKLRQEKLEEITNKKFKQRLTNGLICNIYRGTKVIVYITASRNKVQGNVQS